MSNPGKSKDALQKEIHALRERVEELEQEREVDSRVEETLRLSEEEEHLFSEQLMQLVEINNELSMSESIDQLCRQAVLLARERLGFDRIGIWFRAGESDKINGSYGVDINGEICDERDQVTRVEPHYPDGRVLLNKESFVLEEKAPIVDSQGAIVGYGSQAFTPISDGQQVIGHISIDNRLNGEPITKRQCDLLRLFGSAIGYLYIRKRIEAEHEQTIEQLQEALTKINSLRGLVPICCACKKIRDDKGYWNQIEEYIQDHSEAEFSHGICPECAQRLYPDLYKKKEPAQDKPPESAPEA